MKREPHRAQKTEPPMIEPALRQGPGYDPMDRIVQDLQNIQTFLSHIEEHPLDLKYLDTHLTSILQLRRAIAQQLEQIAEAPYSYAPQHITLLKKENEKIFSYLEGAIGAMNPHHPEEFKRCIQACEKILLDFDGHITP